MNAVTPFVVAIELEPGAPDGALWAGRPRWASAAVHIWKAPWAAAWFALLLADGARLALAPHATPDAWTGELKLLAISIVVVAGLLALAALTARTTRYAIEPRAVVLHYGMALPATLVIPLAAIDRVEVRVHHDGTGDVAMRLKPGPAWSIPSCGRTRARGAGVARSRCCAACPSRGSPPPAYAGCWPRATRKLRTSAWRPRAGRDRATTSRAWRPACSCSRRCP